MNAREDQSTFAFQRVFTRGERLLNFQKTSLFKEKEKS